MSQSQSESDMHYSSLGPNTIVGASLDTRLESIDSKIHDLKNDLIMIDHRIDFLHTSNNNISLEVKEHTLKLNNLESTSKHLELKMENIAQMVEDKLGCLQKNMNIMKNDFKALINQVLDTMQKLNSDIYTLSLNCKQNTSRINSLEKILHEKNLI